MLDTNQIEKHGSYAEQVGLNNINVTAGDVNTSSFNELTKRSMDNIATFTGEMYDLLNDLSPVAQQIVDICDAMKVLLLAKNKKYGNSALEPLNIYSKLSARAGIHVRLDDKLMRVLNSSTPRVNDRADIIGYTILDFIAEGIDINDILKEID